MLSVCDRSSFANREVDGREGGYPYAAGCGKLCHPRRPVKAGAVGQIWHGRTDGWAGDRLREPVSSCRAGVAYRGAGQERRAATAVGTVADGSPVLKGEIPS